MSNDYEYLQICLKLIEYKQKWGDSTDWTLSNFHRLSDEVYESTGVKISHRTFSRLFGKDNYKTKSKPHYDTKDALARYIGFISWDDFLRNYSINEASHDIRQNPNTEKNQIKTKYKVLWVLVFLLLVFAGFFIIHKKSTPSQNSVNNIDHIFTKDTIGDIPFLVKVHLDLANIHSDSIFIKPGPGKKPVKLNNADTVFFTTFKVVGLQRITLMIDGKVVDELSIYAKSKKWETSVLTNDHFYPVSRDMNIKGVLQIDETDLVYLGEKINHNLYWTKFEYYNEFGISADEIALAMRTLGDTMLDQIKCKDFVFWIVGDKNILRASIAQQGCSQYSKIRIGEEQLGGDKYDLSALTADMNTWNDYQIKIHNGKIVFYCNNKLLYTYSTTKQLGKLLGMVVKHRGSGIIDFVQVTDSSNKVVYSNNFD